MNGIRKCEIFTYICVTYIYTHTHTHTCIYTCTNIHTHKNTMEYYSAIKKSCLMVQMLKSLSAMHGTQVQSLGQEDPLEKGMLTHSSILAWRIPWTEEPGRLQSVGESTVHGYSPQRVGHNWTSKTHKKERTFAICNNTKGSVWLPI